MSGVTRMCNETGRRSFLLAVSMFVWPLFAYSQEKGSDIVKSALLKPSNWQVEWRGPGGEGTSDFRFEQRGEKVVVKIQTPSASLSCESDVIITAETATLNGCRDPGILLRFDPADRDYPFKGKSPRNYEYKLKAR